MKEYITVVGLLQFSEHKRRVAEVYNLAAPGYDKPAVRFFPRVADQLVNFARLTPGQTVLDVATGTGVAALAAAHAVGPEGRVVGVDIAAAMLAQAAQNIMTAGLGNVELDTGDAEQLPFADASFDALICSAGLFFLPDMLAGLHEWRRVVRPGGTIAFSSFGPTSFEPLSSYFAARIRHYGVELPEPRPFSWQRLAEPDMCARLLQDAGLEQTAVGTFQLGYMLRDVDEWWDIAWNSGFRGPIARLAPDQRDRFKAEHLAEVAALATADGIWLDIEAVIARGQIN